MHVCDVTARPTANLEFRNCLVRHDPLICVTWVIPMCDVTHSYVWHDSFICMTWVSRMWDMTHSCAWHESFICVTWVIHTCDMSHSYVTHDSDRHSGLRRSLDALSCRCLCAKEPLFIAIQGATDDRKIIRCLYLQVSFHKRAPNWRALLQKMTTKIRQGIQWVFATL